MPGGYFYKKLFGWSIPGIRQAQPLQNSLHAIYKPHFRFTFFEVSTGYLFRLEVHISHSLLKLSLLNISRVFQ